MRYVLGIDVGGTFTDAVAADENGRIVGAKTPSTPEDYAVGVLTAVAELASTLGITEHDLLANTAYIAHGTTSTLNALVTGNIDPVGFISTKGHSDSIAIMNVEGRYLGKSAHDVQDLVHTRKPEPLVSSMHIAEVTERVDQAGQIVVALDEDEVRDVVSQLISNGITAIAVSLLWAFRNPTHEQRIREIIAETAPDVFVSISSEVSPRIREFARSATTIMNTQLGPSLRRYLTPLSTQLADRGLRGPLLIMQSSGGTIAADKAPASAITTVGSVLSGGVVGTAQLAKQLGHSNVITADVGGTTFLVGVVLGGEPVRAAGSIINQHPINVPGIKVDVIGSGGGAIAWVDAGGNLRVGPQSAAAVPGPAAYGRGGTQPTVTDADLVLGIINPEYFLGGKRVLRMGLAEKALSEHIGQPLGLTVQEAAAAVYEVQNAQTADLMRKTVVEAGYDPREFVVYAFGGAGPIHASAFSSELGAQELVVPLGAAASGFSAFGLAASNVRVTAELSDPAPFPVDSARIQANFDALNARARDALQRQGVDYIAIDVSREFDARYTAQMFEVTADAPAGDIDTAAVEAMTKSFENRYAELYGEGAGHSAAGLQIITYRVHGIGRLPFHPTLPPHGAGRRDNAAAAIKQRRQVYLQVDRKFEDTPIYDYAQLQAGDRIPGPAIIEVPTTTVTIPAEHEAYLDTLGNIRLPLNQRSVR